MSVLLLVRPSIFKFIDDEALSNCVVKLVRRPELLIRVVADERIGKLLAIANCIHDLHKSSIQARAIVEDRLSFLRSRNAGSDVLHRFVDGTGIDGRHGVSPVVGRLRNGARLIPISFNYCLQGVLRLLAIQNGGCLDHDRAEVALIGWAGIMRERTGR